MLFHQLKSLLSFNARQNWLASIIWTLSVVGITVVVAGAFSNLYGSAEERDAMAQTLVNPAMVAMVGPAYGIDNYTIGAMMANQMLLFTAIVLGIMSILMITKLTRKQEEEGKFELIRSMPVGRLSSLSSALILVALVNLLIGLATAISLIVINVEGIGVEGSIMYGTILTVTGLIFTGITAVITQLTETSRGALGLSMAVLLVAYFARAIGDVSSEALSLASPLGLILRTEVYVENDWWPIIVAVVITLVFTVLAFYLHNRRDLGAGLLPSKPGKKEASKLLLSPLGLVLRLQRTQIIAWLMAMIFLGASYGSVLGDLESFFADNEMMQQMLGNNPDYTLTEQFITMLMVILSIFATIPMVILFLKIRGEEKKERNDHLLTTGVSRYRLLSHYLGISIVMGVVSLFIALYGLWAAGAAVMDDPVPFENILKAGMSYVPAMLGILAIANLLFAFLPKWTPLVWAYLVFSFFTVYLGGMIDIPEWIANISSFNHIPQIPVEEFSWTPLFVLLAIGIIVLILSQFGYRNRDGIEGQG
ncbi:ABC-2 type transport system permease protein [Gracilibacillus orientalis]|uniref:ABC-2 type transport system permease protein n=1 Tax=Gracilibacillus orientalis TaxID=334253 RepID=A0A1I4RAP3_9BACI|nr:ABC transporter permease [Gracilibacillus orientalis]SFM49096.1 ABC-2 type transport system permease protein [Gracilibacillus orientalis]